MGIPALTGKAEVNPPPLAPNKADWRIDTEAKTATADIMTGTMTIWRKENGRFHGEYLLPQPTEEDPDGKVKISVPLKDCDTLFLAQQRAETLVRETLTRSYPKLAAELAAAETEVQAAQAGDDPF